MKKFHGYAAAQEQEMWVFFRSLPEDHRRRYAAVEAHKIGFGGIAYISQVLGVARGTIYEGLRELQQMGEAEEPHRPSGADSAPGGGAAPGD
jgi:hypothetical protein